MDVNLFKGVDNFRELGGIAVEDGRKVKGGLLFRSAQLSCPYPEDRQMLDEIALQTLVDFRTEGEARAQPDYVPEGCDYLCIPPVDGVAGEGFSFFLMKFRFLSSPNVFFGNLYKKLALGKQAKEAYKRFFSLLLENKTPIVWHCNQGKDRTGIASALLLHCLGASQKVMTQDYLLTNKYMARLHKKKSKGKKLGEKIYGDLLFVKEQNFKKFFAHVEKAYGSIDGYLLEIGIGEKEKERLKGLYLE